MCESNLSVKISKWIINSYDDFGESDLMLQENLSGVSNNEEINLQFRN